jgi:AbrB family looped-hinge helix DNA binding protein
MNPNIFTIKVGEKGRITIPKYYREKMQIKEGDYVVVHVGKVQQ